MPEHNDLPGQIAEVEAIIAVAEVDPDADEAQVAYARGWRDCLAYLGARGLVLHTVELDDLDDLPDLG